MNPSPDPRPEPPVEPPLEACCGSGCDPCIFDLHEEAMARYRDRLAVWETSTRAAKDALP